MQDQLALFEIELSVTQVRAVWGQLTHAQRETALRLLAELMARSVAGGDRATTGRGSEEDSHA